MQAATTGFAYSWIAGGGNGPAHQTTPRGIVRAIGDAGATNAGFCMGPAAASAICTNITLNPSFYTRWAPVGPGAATRFIGLGPANSAIFTTPVDGIYFRHTNAGSIIAVCRKASAETTLDTLVVAADGVFHTGRLVVTDAGASVQVFVDGASKGVINTNVPTVNLNR